MKEIIVLAFLAAQLIGSFSPSATADFRPPGTVEIVDNFFYDSRELRNADWREYIEDLKEKYGEHSEQYLSALPDAQVWFKPDLHMEVYEETYFSHPSYKDYPVVGITHAQATAYCTWRTTAVEKMMARLGKEAPAKFRYRLPTQTEWELVADAGYSQKQKKQVDKQKDKQGAEARFYNMRYTETADYNAAQSSPCSTVTYLPNKYGIYNIYGNIAEMVADPGIAMGGSYRHFYDDIVPSNKPLTYEGAQDWLGFRCVCELITE